MDSGVDFGVDSRVDSGVDSETDSGLDSGVDPETENVDFSLVLEAFPGLYCGPRWHL